MSKFLRTYLPFAKAGMQESIMYRANFFCFILGEMLMCFVMYFVWNAVFMSGSGETFMGFTMENMVVYIFVAFVTSIFTHSDGTYAIGEEIRDGSIAMRMIKPVNFNMPFLFQELGQTFISLFIFVPLIAGVEIYRFVITGSVQFDIVNLLLYILSTVLAYFISFYFNVCYGFSAFVLKNLWGANILKDAIVSFLSGAKIPLAFMPIAVRNVLQFLPFASLSYTPVMIYMGMYDTKTIFFSIVLQVFWIAAFWLLSKLIWKAASKRLCVQGG